MESNIVKAIINIYNSNERPNLKKYATILAKEKDKNRAKAMGSELESYSKDIFANAYNIDDVGKKLEQYNKVLSYLGGSKNPPDFIIRNGAAVEVKKVESTGELQLNSSSPKKILKSTSDKITYECKNCEDCWTEKDMVYIIANQNKNNKIVESIWLIDAKCYIADESIYLKVFKLVKDTISNIDGLNSLDSKELGRIGQIDGLDITKLRVRPMWTLQHPNTVFNSFVINDDINKFRVYALISKKTFESYPESDIKILNQLISDGKITKSNKTVKDPDDKSKYLDVVLLKLLID